MIKAFLQKIVYNNKSYLKISKFFDNKNMESRIEDNQCENETMFQKQPNIVKEHLKKDLITEGGVKISNWSFKEGNETKQEVFYNPVQVFNRDLSLLATLTHAQIIRDEKLAGGKAFYGLRYYDALTASGLRALRTKVELPESLINSVTGCDMSADAIDAFKKNLTLNGLKPDDIEIIFGNSDQYMATKEKLDVFEVVD